MEFVVMKRIFLPVMALCLLAFVFSFGQAEVDPGQKAASLQSSQGEQSPDVDETIVPGPKDIKQATAIYVFLGWIWLSIGILVFFLRLKIKEVDRLHELGFFTEDKN